MVIFISAERQQALAGAPIHVCGEYSTLGFGGTAGFGDGKRLWILVFYIVSPEYQSIREL